MNGEEITTVLDATADDALMALGMCNSMNMLVLERKDNNSFDVLGGVPREFEAIYPDACNKKVGLHPDQRFLFIENFLFDAQSTWSRGGLVKSGPWVEACEDGSDIALEAIASCWSNKKILVIELLGDAYKAQHAFLQMGRENVLVRQYLEEEVRKRTQSIRNREEEIALRLVWASETRDGGETGAHIRRLGLYSELMAELLGWQQDQIDEIKIAATMHDVGKIGIPDSILRKPGQLTKEEFEIMKTHTTIGGRILGGSEVDLLKMACDIAVNHHEAWDGSGYPNGLRGEAIPLAARIVSISDVFDALLNKRVYKSAWPIDEVIANMKKESGKRFDSDLLVLFFDNIQRFVGISENTTELVFDDFSDEVAAG